MSYQIQFHEARCVACGACTVACMDQNDLSAQDRPLRRTEIREPSDAQAHFRYLTVSCLHCANAKCIDACPNGCISRDSDTGFVVYDNDACIGCGACAAVCPVNAPVITAAGKMVKCDGCNERVKAGLPPACVAICPFDALTLVDTANK